MKRAKILLVFSLLVLLAACSTDPKVVSKKYVENGNKYFDRAKYKEASIFYRKALAKDMRYAPAWYQLGLTNEKLGLYGEAMRDFSRAREIFKVTDPNNIQATVKLGDLDLAALAGDLQRNRSLLPDLKDIRDELLKKDPKSYDGIRFSAYIAFMEKHEDLAIQTFQEANRLKPYQPDLVMALVQMLFAKHQTEEGEKLAQELLEKDKAYGPMYDVLYVQYVRSNRPQQGEELLKKKIDNNPKQGAYLLQLALHYYMTQRKPEMTATLARLTSDLKTFPNAHMLVGDFYLRIRDLDNALAQYDQGQRDDSKSKRIYEKKMVEVLGTQHKFDQASKVVDQLLKEDPKDPETIAMHATLVLQTGDKKQVKGVIAELQPLVSKMPGNATLHYNLGRAYLANGDAQSLDQARMQFQEAIKIEPRYIPAKVELAQLELFRKNAAKALQIADEIIAVDQKNLAGRLIRTRALLTMGESTKGREELTLLLKMYPTSTDAQNQLAQLDLFEKHYQAAEADYTALVKANDPRGLPGVMEARIGQGQWDQAISFAEDKLRQAPDRTDYRFALAVTYYRAGKYSQSATEFQKLIDKNSKSSDLFVRMGQAKQSAHDYNGAMAAFKTAKQLAPNDPTPALYLALLDDITLGRFDEARQEYEIVLKLQPDNPMALNNLAFLKADSGVDLDQALDYAQRAQQKMPNNLQVMDTLSLIYIKKNLTDEGLRMLRDLVTRDPTNSTFHLHLAYALYQKGDRPGSKKELQSAMQHKPSEKEQVQIKELLAKVG